MVNENITTKVNRRPEEVEERIHELKDKLFDSIMFEKQKEKNYFKK